MTWRQGQAYGQDLRDHVPAKLSGLEQALTAHVEAHCNQTLAQLCQWVQAEHGIRVGVTAMHKTLARLGLRLKKSPCMPANRNALT